MSANSRLAYYFSTFPSISTTFLQREVHSVREQGGKVVTIANRRPSNGEVHPEDIGFLSDTLYMVGMNPLQFLGCMLRGFAVHVSRLVPALLLAMRLKDRFPRQRLVNLGHLCTGAALNTILKQKRIQHLHVHFALGAASVALFHKALTGMPYTISIHGSDVLLPRPLTEEKLKNAEMIISNCRFHIQNLTRKHPSILPAKFKIIRLGLALNRPPWTPEPVASPVAPLRILHVGRMVPVKAHEVLIDACRKLGARKVPFECRLIGDGPCRADLEKKVRDLDLQTHVCFLGNRFSDAVAASMAWSHVVVLCSKSEGTPMTLIEAMAKGRAVIAPNITAIPEMVLPEKNGLLFEREDAEQLANCLVRFVKEAGLAELFGKTGRRIAEETYDMRRCSGELLGALAPFLS